LTDWGRVIDTAREIASKTHATQLDKGGQPYIQHPDRVSRNVHSYIEMLVVESKKRKYETINDVLELSGNCVAAAWLHDVIEDSGDYGEQITAEDLLAAGIPAHVVDAVVLLTDDARVPESVAPGIQRRAMKTRIKLDYYARIKSNEIARIVKLADLADNNNLARAAAMRAAGGAVDPAKYPLALASLELSPAEWGWFNIQIKLPPRLSL
jgi:(p)ppGpp synthase/HD superfamily hydrolase